MQIKTYKDMQREASTKQKVIMTPITTYLALFTLYFTFAVAITMVYEMVTISIQLGR